MIALSFILFIVYCLNVTCFNTIQKKFLATDSFGLSSFKMSSSEGYGPFGSLIRQGPVPFFIRITNPSTYEAAVEKYMNIEKCDRNTAQGNMDAYFQDPNGWAARKLRVKREGLKDLDYANMGTDKGSLVLTAVWAVGILSLFYSDDLFVAKSSPATLLSLAYHHGYLIYSDPADNNGQLVWPNLEVQRILLETLLICNDEKKLRPIINKLLLAAENKDKNQKGFFINKN